MKKGMLIALAIVFGVAAVASADTVLVRRANPPSDFVVGTSGSIDAYVKGVSYTGASSIATGLFDLEISYNNGVSYSPLLTYCLEPDRPLFPTDPTEYSQEPLSNFSSYYVTGLDASEITEVEQLWAQHFSTTPTPVEAAAFQTIIWELAVDSSYDLNTGQFYLINGGAFTNAAESLADTWFAALSGAGQPLDLLHHPVPSPAASGELDDYQDLLIPVPAPGAALLAMIGFGMVGWVKRRFA